MKVTKIKNVRYSSRSYATSHKIITLVEFNNLSEFINYIETQPTNMLFTGYRKASQEENDYRTKWTLTKSWDEAIKLAKYGWIDGAKNLNENFKFKTRKTQPDFELKQMLDVSGYQAIVPLYLQGSPLNMVNKKATLTKQKIITINKVMSYSSGISTEDIVKNSSKCLAIINSIERKGYRVNLNMLISTGKVCVKIRLKSANERLNVAKLAFPMIHPAMFRRLFFRFIEVFPEYKEKRFMNSYGVIPYEDEFTCCCQKNEVMMSTIMRLGDNFADDLVEKLLKNF